MKPVASRAERILKLVSILVLAALLAAAVLSLAMPEDRLDPLCLRLADTGTVWTERCSP